MVSAIRVSTTYPLLKKGALLPSKRSTYYHLKPIGINTSAVESLTSYISRLAAAHCISIATLYEFTVVPSLNKSYLAAPEHQGPAFTLLGTFRNQIKNINGVGKVAREWADLFEKLTLHQGLRRLTFLPWSEVLTPLNLQRTYQAWCPACYEEMRDTGNGAIYQPLIWNLLILQICTKHRVNLVDQCPKCNRKFFCLTRRLRLGFCPKCYHWLGRNVDISSPQCSLKSSQLEWQEFVGDNICELISFEQDETRAPSKEHIAKWLQALADRITDGKMQRLSALLGKSNLTVHEWRHGRIKPLLFELLRICYCFDLRLVDFLTGIGTDKKTAFNSRQFPYELEPIKKPRTTRPFDFIGVERLLKKRLTVFPPISMTAIAGALGHDRNTLYKYFPELCRKLCDRYREFLQAEYRTLRTQREEEVREACLGLFKRGVYLTDRSVAEFMGKPSYKGRRDVRAVIVAIRKELGQSRK